MIKKLPSIFILFLLIIYFYLFLYDFFTLEISDPSKFGKIVFDRDGKILRVFLSEDEQYSLPLDSVPNKIAVSLVNYEDKKFYNHCGVNILSIGRAFFQNLSKGYNFSGASTISMQLVRLLKPRDRTYLSKLREIISALAMEVKFSKDEILLSYINNAPCGYNIRGYRTASLKYFDREPNDLSWAETSFLTSLQTAPGTFKITNTSFFKGQMNRNMRELFNRNVIDSLSFISSNYSVPDTIKLFQFPFRSPHLTNYLKYSDKHDIQTTISLSSTDKVESIVNDYSKQLENYNISNCSVIILDNENASILVYLGSNNYYSEYGMVDGLNSRRSSGSILKPFLSALAMDDGIVNKYSILPDFPVRYFGFDPRNSDNTYRGYVTLKESLIHSYNLPFVDLLMNYGQEKFYGFLSENLSTIDRSPDDYGLSLIIGGGEVKPIEIAGLYCSLANDGVYREPQYIKEDLKSSSKKVLSKSSSWTIANILKSPRPINSNNYVSFNNLNGKIAWKTGTSFGKKDAWSCGFGKKYTVIVWCGNFNGEPNPNLSGLNTASPLLFKIMNRLGEEEFSNTKPEFGFTTIEICIETGYPASEECKDTFRAEIVKPQKPLEKCLFHKQIPISKKTGFSVCSKCWNDFDVSYESFFIVPDKIKPYFGYNKKPFRLAPSHNPNCESVITTHKPIIIYPKKNDTVEIIKDIENNDMPITFTVSYKDDNKTLFWFINDSLISRTESTYSLNFTPPKGENLLKVYDQNGNFDMVKFNVK
ncbi:MAG: penicillin-binding protein 1C [Candidatus Delongbacteria bacterium]|nr:penicillin-binding protein 1C [Candidatus Delongbacteria bacterium]MBN2833509.1 penicillin-binding protein 1C [Candidatus Delongbacteria bacterium]